jgi:hypothetical protein
MKSRRPDRPHWSRRDWLTGAAALAGAPLVAELAGCASAPPAPLATPLPVPVAPQVAPLADGRRLAFRAINRYNGVDLGDAHYAVVAVAQSGPGRTLDVSLPPSNTYPESGAARTGRCVLATATAVSQELFYDLQYEFQQPDRLAPDGLAIGTGAVIHNRYRRGDSPYWQRWDTRVSGLGWERITVPAGAFDTLRVRRTIWFEQLDSVYGGHTRDEQLWFAPALGYWVRREYTGYHFVLDSLFHREEDDAVRFELIQS